MRDQNLSGGLKIDHDMLFRSFMDSATDYIILLDENLVILDVNATTLRLAEMSREMVLGKPITEFFPEMKSSRRFEKYLQVIRTGKPYFIDDLVITEGKHDVHVSLKAFKIGKGLGFIATDITNRIMSERALEKERHIFRIIAAGSLESLNISELCQGILKELVTTMNFDLGVIRLLDGSGDGLEPVAITGLVKDQVQELIPVQPLADKQYIATHVIRTGEPIFAPDVTLHPIYKTHRKRIDFLNIRSMISWPIFSGNNEIIGIIHVAGYTTRDISDRDRNFFTTVADMCAAVISRRQADLALQKSELKHRELLSSFRTPVLALREDLSVLYCNEAYAGMAELTPEDMADRPLTQFIKGGGKSPVYQIYRNVLKTGKTQEFTHRVKDRVFLLIIQRTPRGILVITEDVTERKKAEDEVLKEREYYRTFVESLTDWAWEMDNNGVHTYSNSAVTEILGFDVEQVVGHPLTKLWTSGCKTPRSRKHFKTLLARQDGWKNFVGNFRHKDGSTVWTESTALPIFDEKGTLTGFRGLDRDITKRKAAEDALRQSARKIEILHETVRRLGACETEGEIYMETVNAAEHLFDVAVSVIARCLNGGFAIKAVSSGTSTQGLNFELLNQPLAEQCMTRDSVYWTGIDDCPEKAEYFIEPFRSILAAPLGDIGVFQALSLNPQAFCEGDARILSLLLEHTRETLNRLTLQNNLTEQATHDPLTGVHNRHYLKQALDQEARRARRYGHMMAFLMIDIDRFKEINDRYGHQAGDNVLRGVADLLIKSVRETDIVVRYGGDEFLLILPESDPTANSATGRIDENLQEFNTDNSILDFPLTLSVGCAYWDPEDTHTLEDIQNLADHRMYQNKAEKYQSP